MINVRAYFKSDKLGSGVITRITQGEVAVSYGSEEKIFRVGTYIP